MNKNKIIISTLLILLILSGLASFGFLYFKPFKNPATPSKEATNNDSTNTNTLQPTTENSNTTTELAPTSTLKAGEDMNISSIKYTDLPNDLFSENFVWQTPEKIAGQGMVVENYSPCGSEMDMGCIWYKEADTNYYQIANFTYKNNTGTVFYFTQNVWITFGISTQYKNKIVFVKYNNQTILLSKMSPDLTDTDGLNKIKFLVDKNLELPKNLNIPKELNVTGKQKLILIDETVEPVYESNGITAEKVAYFDNKDIWSYGDFFLTFTNNIQNIQPVQYNIVLPNTFILKQSQKIKTDLYDSTRLTGCGGRGGVDVIKDLNEKDLEIIGKANDGNIIYKYSNIADGSEEAEMFKNYNGYKESSGQATTTFENFLSNNPIIIMKDGFGRFIRFTSREYYIQMAECGKPVIYLYPTKETKVNVQIKPNGGLTKVDPFYPTDGWLVNAKPNSELTNTDGKNYPYLFWEGNAYNLKVPTDGFVLKKENIKRDMIKLLARLGLNEKESADFLEFWQTKLEVKPYVFVTFVSQSEFDRVAPINISPRPDKTIRVFMEYQPLDYSFNTRPLKIETPTRTGFTVVEWGGRLHQ